MKGTNAETVFHDAYITFYWMEYLIKNFTSRALCMSDDERDIKRKKERNLGTLLICLINLNRHSCADTYKYVCLRQFPETVFVDSLNFEITIYIKFLS